MTLLMENAAAVPPNLILVLTDDTGYCDVGYCDPDIKTPIIDSLAKDGVKLGSLYTWNWCAPSRGAILSGRYATRNGYGGGGKGSSAGGECF